MGVPYSQNLIKSLSIAASVAEKTKATEINTVHLLYGMYNCGCQAAQILQALGISPVHFNMYFNRYTSYSSGSAPANNREIDEVLRQSADFSQSIGAPEIYTEIVLSTMCRNPSLEGVRFISKFANINNLNSMLSNLLTGLGFKAQAGGSRGENPKAKRPQSERKEEDSEGRESLPQELADFGTDFTERARQGKIDPVIGREFEIQRLTEILCRKTKNNPVLIGEPGVGKSAVAEGLALRIVSGEVPEQLSGKTIFSLDIGSLMAGTRYRGDLEERLKRAIAVLASSENIIVFIDELHTLVRAGDKEGGVNPADMLKPYLARGEIQTIGATTTDEYRKFVEKDKALERRFQPVMVNPPTIEQTIEILKGIRPKYEEFHKIKITDDAIIAAANLSDRYISDRFLPDKAIDLVDEASSRAKINVGAVPQNIRDLEHRYEAAVKGISEATAREDYRAANDYKTERDAVKAELDRANEEWNRKNGNKSEIGKEEIAEVISRWTGIPVAKLTESDIEKLNNLETILHKRVVGQDEAVTSVCKAIRRSRAGLHDPNRPVGTFLFLGPTGVGKTELSKAVAESMFDSEDNIIRIDMSEYMEAFNVSKLIGSPPGYVGFDDGGQLTEQVRRRPYSVVLFDEIEKAHPDVYNILLQILDEGRLTDAQGRLVNFKNTIIIMTSNVGISDLKKQNTMGFGDVSSSSQAKDREILGNALKKQFKPEFLNRIDVICYFNRLKEDDIREIADILFKKVTERLGDRNISVRLTPEVVDYIIKNGYDAEYGARPLKRLIEQSIEDTLAEALLTGKVKEGGVATLEFDGEKVLVT